MSEYKLRVVSATPTRIVKGIKFRSSNKKIATVTAKGMVKAKKKGKAVITIRSGKKTAKCKITVK